MGLQRKEDKPDCWALRVERLYFIHMQNFRTAHINPLPARIIIEAKS